MQFGRKAFSIGVCMAAVAMAQEPELPIKGLRLPLELFADGSVKMQLVAAQALVPEGDGEVEATGVVVTSFNADGRVIQMMEADRCWYNRTTGRIDTDGPVYLARGDMEVTAVGMEWKASDRKLRLYSQVRVVLQGVSLGKVLPRRSGAGRAGTSGEAAE